MPKKVMPKQSDVVKIEESFTKIGVPNPSGRVYPESVVQKAIDEFKQNDIKLGQMGRDITDKSLNLYYSSHDVLDVYIDNNNIICEIRFLSDYWKALYESLYPHLAMIGEGRISEDNVVHDFRIISFNFTV